VIFNSVAPRMPAGQTGLVVGDRLLAIDGVPTRGMTAGEATNHIRGAAGTPLSLTVAHTGKDRTLQLIRAALTRVDPNRLAGLLQTLKGLHDLTASTQQTFADMSVYWQFKGHGDQSLAPGTRTAAAVIEVPQGTKRLSATITWDIDLQRTRFEKWFNVPTKIEEVPVELPLL
jgi:hypothetical protein